MPDAEGALPHGENNDDHLTGRCGCPDWAPHVRATADYVRLRRVLVEDARDLLWHNPGHVLGGTTTDCPGCDLEAQLDAALEEHSNGIKDGNDD